MVDRLIDAMALAGPIMGGLFAWWAACHLPLPRWWATR